MSLLFLASFTALSSPPETSLHSDVRRAFRGRRKLRMSHPGSDPSLSCLSYVRGLMELGQGVGSRGWVGVTQHAVGGTQSFVMQRLTS